jgi:REP element-mobilizing transposase RayT
MRNESRKSLRLADADYGAPGAYFVTICVGSRLELFGTIVNDGAWVGAEHCSAHENIPITMQLNTYGEIANKYLAAIPEFYRGVRIDSFVVMPNHVHALVVLEEQGAGISRAEQCSARTAEADSLRAPRQYGLVSKIVKSYKEAVVKEIRQSHKDYEFHWQRSFYDRIVRNEQQFVACQQYIKDNPLKWWEKYQYQ